MSLITVTKGNVRAGSEVCRKSGPRLLLWEVHHKIHRERAEIMRLMTYYCFAGLVTIWNIRRSAVVNHLNLTTCFEHSKLTIFYGSATEHHDGMQDRSGSKGIDAG
jgi:hypothetical protein